jgi:predicted tellurium resistance membrane protein TerC
VPKGYVYFAMAFAVGVEMLNLRLRKRVMRAPALRKRHGRDH